MGRGKYIKWTPLLGVPFLVVGLYLYFFAHDYPPALSYPFLLFGLFIMLTGLYVYFRAAPEAPNLRENENIVASQHPIQRVAAVELIIGSTFLIIAVYFLLFTFRPYVYPTVAFLIGLYLFSSGLYTYWANSLTTYYITNQRVISEYRFLSLVKHELSLDKVRGVEERRSVVETLVGLGNVYVASGGGRSLEIEMKNMKNSGEFADKLRGIL